MLENRYKKNSESNILTSIILVMLMVFSTTIAMMIPTEWDEPEAIVDVEYSPMESSPAMQSMNQAGQGNYCLLYTSPSPRDRQKSRMPSSA